jgi:phosphotransferase system HPr (HPr) family protein
MDATVSTPNGGPLRKTVVLTNPSGFHLRPMQAFVELAAKYQSAIRVRRDEQGPVDGKSIWALMSLAAEHGTALTVEVDGPDAPDALEKLVDLLANLETRLKMQQLD